VSESAGPLKELAEYHPARYNPTRYLSLSSISAKGRVQAANY